MKLWDWFIVASYFYAIFALFSTNQFLGGLGWVLAMGWFLVCKYHESKQKQIFQLLQDKGIIPKDE